MYDSQRGKIYSQKDAFIDPISIKDINSLIDYHSHKKVISKIIDNLDLFISKSFLDPSLMDVLFDKIVKVCVHYEMLENLDQIMVESLIPFKILI